MAFGLQYEALEESLPTSWRAVIIEQAHVLETMLWSVQKAMELVKSSTDTRSLTLAQRLADITSETAEQLTQLAQQSLVVEQQIGRLMVRMQQTQSGSPQMMKDLQVIEQVNAILHANIILSRALIARLVA